MALSVDATRQIEQDLLLKADVLAHYLNGFGTTDPERAKGVCAEIIARLKNAVLIEADFESRPDRLPPSGQRATLRVASRSGGGDDTEEFILENLANSPRGLSVQEIVDRFEEAEMEIKRATLVVRLHRMVQAGKLTSRTHGHYDLSEAEHSRRQSA
jgi:hypothetical protein